MERYTIRPLLTLLRSDKNTFNRNDLAQVTAKVRNTMKRKAASPSDKERFSVFTEKKYLEILKTLTAAVPTGKITRAELIEATDKILQDANFVFIKKEHVPAHDNYFLPAPNAAPPPAAIIEKITPPAPTIWHFIIRNPANIVRVIININVPKLHGKNPCSRSGIYAPKNIRNRNEFCSEISKLMIKSGLTGKSRPSGA